MSQENDHNTNAHQESISKIPEILVTNKEIKYKTRPTPVLKAQDGNRKSFPDRMKTHPFFLVRGIYYIFYSVWAIVMTIGMLIAWLIAMLFI